MMMPSCLDESGLSGQLRTALGDQLKLIANQCTQCQRCVAECSFLEQYGDPKTLADCYDPDKQEAFSVPFECHLCGLCRAVCPHDLDPASLFLEMRRQAFECGQADFPAHKSLRRYEKTGTSKRFSWYSLPPGCDSVFFPGCALSGSRSQTTYRVYQYLQQQIPAIGIVLDCCTKPSHDLGDIDLFNSLFGEMKACLLDQGVKTIFVACPNCQKMFTEYGHEFSTQTVYELLDQLPLPEGPDCDGPLTVHDPCVSRFYTSTQESVRSLLNRKGFRLVETPHTRQTTFCCGEGAGVKSFAPEKSEQWLSKKFSEQTEHDMVSYCAACAATFSQQSRCHHLLDLLFDTDNTLKGNAAVASAPVTYFKRLQLKQRLRSQATEKTVTHERTSQSTAVDKLPLLKKILLLACLSLAFVGVRSFGGQDYLHPDKLQDMIAGYGYMAPLVYMLIYAVAPALFLPGLPLGMAGGIIFGPFWGVIYTIVSATVGACVAFLISRYLARDIIESKLKGRRWQSLNDHVEKNGWKMVALTRLTPLFPFNLLNYAYGLTSVRFSHYCLATFIFMLPGTIAFITLSSSLLDLLQGQMTRSFVVGLLLVLTVSSFPLIYRWLKRNEKS